MAKQKEFTTHIESTLSDTWADQSEVANAVLDHVLHVADPGVAENNANQVSVEAEKRAPSILTFDSGRAKSRVLFITTNTAVLEKGSIAEKYYLEQSYWFDEVHVMVLLSSRSATEETERISTNMWTYSVQAVDHTVAGEAALSRAEEDLLFNDSLRPDIIVAMDPLVSGVAAMAVGKRFGRVWQVQINNAVFGTDLQPAKISFWEKRAIKNVVHQAPSVRYGSSEIEMSLKQKVSIQTADQRVLPQYYNFDAFKNGVPAFDLHERYPEYKLIILTFGDLTADSHLHDVFVSLRNILYQNRIGLVVVGSGPAKKLFTEKASLLGIEKNVVFVSESSDLTSYFKTADVLIETGLASTSDEMTLRALAAQLPIVAYETELRLDLLEDGRSALLCPAGDPHCLSQKMVKFINSQALRVQFKRQSKTIADTRLYEDKEAYYQALRDSIEVALLPEEQKDTIQEQAVSLKMPVTAAAN